MAETLFSINPALHVGSRINHSRPLLKCRGGGGGGMRRVVVVNMSLSHHHHHHHHHNDHHNNQPYWAAINDQIQAHLKKVVTVKDPVSVFEPMHHLVFSSPPDTAPALCVAACDLVGGGGGGDQALAAAAALQVIHAASFTHEYLPLSDRPSLMPRAGPGPMGHHAFGPNVELLTGDGMVPFGLELVAKSDDPAQNSSDRILRVIIEITRAIGSLGLVDGQYSELQYSQLDGNGSWHMELINNTCEKKEGGLHACAAACGAILGGGSEEEIEKLRRFGLYVGMIRGTLRRYSPEKRSIRVEELRNLALKELEGFDEANVKAISSFVEGNLSYV